MPRQTISLRFAALATLSVLGGCEGQQDRNDIAALDAQLASNKAEPALQNQIVVDPGLVEGGNAVLAADPAKPLDALAQTQAQPGDCADKLAYDDRWADRLPMRFAPYPGAKRTEAAGSDQPPCNLVAVSYTAKAPMKPVLDHYTEQATRAGYTADRQQDGASQMLGGTRARDDTAFMMTFTPRPDGGTEIDLISRPKG